MDKLFLSENACFSTIKVKLVDETMQSNYSYVILHLRGKTLLILTVFYIVETFVLGPSIHPHIRGLDHS